MKIAVIGAGGAGLTSAWLLDENHEVTLYEKEDRLGGHAHTITIDVQGQSIPIDAGFEFFSDVMFPTYVRFLNLLKVPSSEFPMRATMYNTKTGADYMMPPFHGWRMFPEEFTPFKLVDMLHFTRILRASGEIMRTRDTSITAERFFDDLNIPEAFRTRFLYPFLQAGWGVSLDEIKTFIIYDIMKYSFLNTPATLIPRGWKEIEGGTQTYVQAVANSFKNVCVKLNAGVTTIERTDNGYRVVDTHGQAAVYDHVIMATNANQAAAALAHIDGTDELRRYLNQFSYFETTIAVHGDAHLMPPKRRHWSLVNIRHDGTFSQFSIWKRWKDGLPIFKSWVTHDDRLPNSLYATAKYLHPRVDTSYFTAQAKLQPFQGKNNIWLTGMYMIDIDCHESAVLSAIEVARQLDPQSARLKQLSGATSVEAR